MRACRRITDSRSGSTKQSGMALTSTRPHSSHRTYPLPRVNHNLLNDSPDVAGGADCSPGQSRPTYATTKIVDLHSRNSTSDLCLDQVPRRTSSGLGIFIRDLGDIPTHNDIEEDRNEKCLTFGAAHTECYESRTRSRDSTWSNWIVLKSTYSIHCSVEKEKI